MRITVKQPASLNIFWNKVNMKGSRVKRRTITVGPLFPTSYKKGDQHNEDYSCNGEPS